MTHYQLQRSQYSGHKKRHGFSAQDVILPNGIIMCHAGEDGRRADPFVLLQSNVLPQLPNMANSTGLQVLLTLRREVKCSCTTLF